MADFDFTDLINEYSTEYTLISYSNDGYDEYGEYQKGVETRTTMYGAIISAKESKIYRSEGNLTAQDKVLQSTQPLKNALTGSKVVYEGNLYNIQESGDNSKFTGVWRYVLKYVSAFNEGVAK